MRGRNPYARRLPSDRPEDVAPPWWPAVQLLVVLSAIGTACLIGNALVAYVIIPIIDAIASSPTR